MEHPTDKKILFFGLTTWDIIYSLDQYPAWDSKNNANSLVGKPGGPSFGAAQAAHVLGDSAVLATAIGHSGLGENIYKCIEELGIHLMDAASSDLFVAPIASVVALPNGQRTVFTSKSSFTDFNRFVSTVDWSKIAMLCLDGHYLDTAIQMAKMARSLEIPVLLDGGSWKEGIEDLLPLVDDAVLSQYFFPPHCSSHAEVLAEMKRYDCFSAITQGANDILLADGETIPVQALASPKLSNGAGDVLHGAYASFRKKGIPARECLRCAAEIATKYCQSGMLV